jgi:hypothetical protein
MKAKSGLLFMIVMHTASFIIPQQLRPPFKLLMEQLVFFPNSVRLGRV